jgi:hypothetical protein
MKPGTVSYEWRQTVHRMMGYPGKGVEIWWCSFWPEYGRRSRRLLANLLFGIQKGYADYGRKFLRERIISG